MGFWDSIETADPNAQDDYFSEGEYEVTIEGVKEKLAKDGAFRGDSVIFLFTVVTASNGTEPGTPRCRVLKMSGPNAMYTPGEVKAIISAAYGKDATDKGEWGKQCSEIAKRMTDASNPLKGLRVRLSAFDRPNQKQFGKVWTKHNWYPAEGVNAVPPPPAPPPPPGPPEVYHPTGTSPGKGATHVLRNGAWQAL